jgi:hypothetical protein
LSNRPAWHALLAPLPADAILARQPVAPPEVLARPEGAAVAGWEQLVVHLSAVPNGSRTVLVLVDGDGRPLSASDGVVYRTELPAGTAGDPRPAVQFEMESVGGRLELDGRFLGTRWRTVTITREVEDEEEVERREATPSAPSDADVAALKALVAEIVRRAARQSG